MRGKKKSQNNELNKTKKSNQSNNTNLINEIKNQNFKKVKDLIDNGADVNYIQYTGSNAWYEGSTKTPLYYAIHAGIIQQGFQEYFNIIKYLLLNGADTKFQARSGGWTGSNMYPLLHNIVGTISEMETSQNVIRFFKLLGQYNVNFNKTQASRSYYRRRSNYYQSLLISLMNQGCMPSKINELRSKYQTINFQKLRQEQQSKLKNRFNEQNEIDSYIISENSDQDDNKSNSDQCKHDQFLKHEQDQSNIINVSVIKELLQLGADPDSSAGHYYSQNSMFDDDDDDDDGDQLNVKIHHYFNKNDRQDQNVLHRAIMNNQVDLVRLLLKKRASIEQKLTFTIEVPFYPHQWSSQLKQWTIRQNTHNLQRLQKSKMKLQDALELCNVEWQKQKIKKKLQNVQFSIFKAVNFSIDNQVPLALSHSQQLTCLELAQFFKVNQQITNMLKNPPKLNKRKGQQSQVEDDFQEQNEGSDHDIQDEDEESEVIQKIKNKLTLRKSAKGKTNKPQNKSSSKKAQSLAKSKKKAQNIQSKLKGDKRQKIKTKQMLKQSKKSNQ